MARIKTKNPYESNRFTRIRPARVLVGPVRPRECRCLAAPGSAPLAPAAGGTPVEETAGDVEGTAGDVEGTAGDVVFVFGVGLIVVQG